MWVKCILTTLMTVMIGTIAVTAQLVPSRPPRTIDPNRQDPATKAWYEELKKRENVSTGIGSMRETNETLIARLKADARKKLGPTDEEKREYSEFLGQPKTGLVRLAAETDCARILDVANPDSVCLNYYLPGKARAFSFRKADYVHQAYADLERSNGMFISPGTYVLGLIASLGDVPIEKLSNENQNVAELLRFVPATDIDNVVEQDRDLAKGLRIGAFIYRKVAPLVEHTTYLLRSVAYKAKFLNVPKTEKKRGSLDEDERLDVVIVLRVIRKEADGSLLLLWKELQQKPAPVLTVDLAN
jgi:hypothetical protein